ncbi:MAG: metallophosphoesterase [Caulobacteraceae bacterium]|nr:metallophosphoesterase [Caulobacteraceae bacterium]
MRIAMLAALIFVVALALAGSSDGPALNQSPPAEAAPVAWVQLTGAGQRIRAVAASGRCPALTIDGARRPMSVRAAPDADFPVTVCQASAPSGARTASIGGRPLPLLTAPPKRILIFGDSGCRLKGADIQDCNNTAAWPFPEVARRAAAMKPDLVIHVGDYLYREKGCPPGRAGCAGTPYGDNWMTWRADFIDPVQPLMQAAPVILVRGNHESCARGGKGWTRLLDAGDDGRNCPATSAAYAIDIGGLKLDIVDSAEADDRNAPPMDVARITRQLDAFGPDLAHEPSWLITHRPVWAVAPVARLPPLDPVEVSLNRTLQAAVRARDISGVRLILSGHVHNFASYDFGPTRPAQLVAGTGGGAPGEADLTRPRHSQRTIDGLPAQRLTFQRFGYLMMERDGENWNGIFYGLDDKVVATCRLEGRSLRCKAAEPGAKGSQR